MTERHPLPQPSPVPAPPPTPKTFLLPLLLLTLICCSAATSASAGADEQGPEEAAAAGPPDDTLVKLRGLWSSDSLFLQDGTSDLDGLGVGSETTSVDTREFRRSGAQKARDGAKRGADKPAANHLQTYNPENRITITENFDHPGDQGDHDRTAAHDEFPFPGRVEIQTAGYKGRDLQGCIRQGDCDQEAPEYKKVSSLDKGSDETEKIRREFSILAGDWRARSVAGAVQKEAQSRRERQVDPSSNKGEEKDEDQLPSQWEPLLPGANGNDPTESIKGGSFPPLVPPPPDAHGAVLNDGPFSQGLPSDGIHGEHDNAGVSRLYTPGGNHRESAGVSASELYIPSASPVAAPPRNDPWQSLKDTSSGGASLADVPYEMPDGSWNSGSLGGAEGQTMGEYGDYRQAWETSGEDYHSPDYAGGPILHLTGAAPPSLTSECGCWDTNSQTPEVECRCWGPLKTQVPTDLNSTVTMITLTDVGMEILRNNSFTRYRSTLQEIVLENVRQLSTIEAGAFNGLHQLRSIYIHSAPLLQKMPNLTFSDISTSLRSIRITNSGLEKIPVMQFTGPEDIVHIIELDNNRIKKVHRRSLKVRVEQLSLNFNLIECVEKEAFDGSKIGKLSLKGNTQLKSLHPEAFQGIGSLRTLDLSETSITSLPTLGLTDLEILLLEKTPTLKIFPSVYSFKTIKEAHLTYPYHCCAFQFPEQHDPEQYIRHQEFLRKMEREHCSDVTSPSPPLMAPGTRLRRRRHTTPAPTTTPAMDESQGLRDLPAPVEMIPDERTEQGKPRETWGSVRSPATGGAILLSSVTNRGGKKYNATRKFDHDEVLEKPQLQLADSSPRTKKSSPVRQYGISRWQRGAPNFVSKEGLAFPRTRHYGHHTRHTRSKHGPNVDLEEREAFHAAYNFGDNRSRYRRGDRIRQDLPLARHSWGDDGADHMLLYPTPQQQYHGRTAALRNPEKDLVPLPEKRFKSEESGHRHHEEDNDGFLGGGAVGGFPSSFLGFGAFNHTSERYLPGFPRNVDSPQGWGDSQGWQGGVHAPPLDSGDDLTYGGSPFEVHEGNHALVFPGEEEVALFPPVGFPDDGGFPDDTFEGAVGGRGEGDHDRSSSLHQMENQWHGSQAPVNNTMIVVLCGNLSKDYHKVLCVPGPDAFNPCEDIMGNLALRVAVWLVVVTAVVGNLAVMVVLISSKFKMTVSKFLMVNLALADLCMGLYLLIIATMDLHTIGVYFNHAIDWQNGPGCKVAGFLTVFASELSIFTLTVITSERWYAITYAIHLNKRLKLSMAIKVMVVGWAYSITMAALPLLGISSYSKTSICLPMETGDALALTYLIALLLVNGLAFFVITACYASMYCSISRHDATAPNSDLTVAKRMALLVFTDFACWAPIAFFGLTAVAGLPLINVTRAKILLVFFYPLNSCANPYLYAILTKQYRRDLFILLARYGFCTKRAMRYKGPYSSVNNTFPHNTLVNAPNHRNSTLTQITLCDLTRTARTSQQSNNGSLLGAMVEGSQDSLQRNVSPLRTPTKPEMVGGENERLSTVQEMSHSTHSDDDNSDDVAHPDGGHHDSPSGVVKQAGSPHPIKNCYTRLSFTPEQEEILKQALHESKARKKAKSDGDRGSHAPQESTDQGKPATENGKSFGHGEVVVICEVEVNHAGQSRSVSDHGALDKADEATSTV